MAGGIKDSGYAQLSGEEHRGIAIRTLRAQFLAQPPERQAETLVRVRSLLEEEQRRKRT